MNTIKIDLVPTGTPKNQYDLFGATTNDASFEVFAKDRQDVKNAVRKNLGKTDAELPDTEILVHILHSRKFYN